MSADSERLKAALSECGLFKAAEADEPPAQARSAVREAPPPPPQAAAPAASDRGILDALDKILPQEPSRPSSRSEPPPAEKPAPARREAPPERESRSASAEESELDEKIERAVAMGSAALHFDPEANALRIRARIGSERTDLGSIAATVFRRRLTSPDASANGAALTELKCALGGRARRLRVDRLPTATGERFVVTGLAPVTPLELEDLLLEPEVVEVLRESLARRCGGLVLLAAPPGEGARTTLRAVAASCAREGKLVISLTTAPVPGAVAVRNGPLSAADRPAALAEALRHDPDVVLLGRIRSLEDAAFAVRAVAEGRHVLAALTARSAADGVAAAESLSLGPRTLGGMRPLLLGQRLAKSLCALCREPSGEAPEGVRELGIRPSELDAASFYRAVGCPRCFEGYRGRVVLAEALAPLDETAEAVLDGKRGKALEDKLGGLRIRQSASRAAAGGRTTVEEALRSIA